MHNQDDSIITELRQKWDSMSKEEKMDVFLWKMVWFHHTKHYPGNSNDAINKLTDELGKSAESSEALTRSIKNATWAASIIGGCGLIVAVINLFQ